MVLTYVIVGASGGILAFLLNFAVAELISLVSVYLMNKIKGALMSKYIMESYKDIKNKFGLRGFGYSR